MDIKEMKELIRAVSESNITDFEYEDDNQEIHIKKDMVRQEFIAAPQAVSAMPPIPQMSSVPSMSEMAQPPQNISNDQLRIVKSPLVGTFYSSASPDAEPFVKVGDKVAKGQVLGIIEAMKLMNDIESEFDGEIAEILVNNKDMVEYNQPLFKIR